ncbi:MAG: hypothetical protein ABIJ41_01670 [Candidatus Omnitrophota bacterium]
MTLISRKCNFAILSVVLVIIGCLGIAESVIRIHNAFEKKRRKIWIPDPFIGYVHAPNNEFVWENKSLEEFSVHHKTNSLGLLGDEISIQKPAHVFRIIMLGDSFTEALQIEKGKSFCKRLEKLLNENMAPGTERFEVLNAGVSGYSPIMQYQYYKRKLSRLNPDLVILQMWTNDVFEDYKVAAMSVLDKEGLPTKINLFFNKKYINHSESAIKNLRFISFVYDLNNFLMDHSRFYEYMYGLFVRLNKNSPYNKKMTSQVEYDDGYQFSVIMSSCLGNHTQRALANTEKYILALKRIVEENGSRFFVFYIPHEAQLALDHYSSHTTRYFSQLPADTCIDDFLKEESQKQKFEFFDLLDTFETNKQKKMFIDYDGHLNEVGHEVVAQALFNFYQERGKGLGEK